MPSRNSERIEIFGITYDETGANIPDIFNSSSRNHTEPDNTTAYRAFDPYEILIRLTDITLIVNAMMIVISLLITFATASLAIFRTAHGHVKDIQDTGIHVPLAYLTLEDFRYISSIATKICGIDNTCSLLKGKVGYHFIYIPMFYWLLIKIMA